LLKYYSDESARSLVMWKEHKCATFRMNWNWCLKPILQTKKDTAHWENWANFVKPSCYRRWHTQGNFSNLILFQNVF
jgi:hypothetical protein